MNWKSIILWFKRCPYKDKNCRKMSFINGCSLCSSCFDDEVQEELCK